MKRKLHLYELSGVFQPGTLNREPSNLSPSRTKAPSGYKAYTAG
jgi:hypothetical protein